MTLEEERDLNLELAKFVWPDASEIKVLHWARGRGEIYANLPLPFPDDPDFRYPQKSRWLTRSLDACMEHIWPLIRAKWGTAMSYRFLCSWALEMYHLKFEQEPAIVFCLAAQKALKEA